MQSWGSQMTKTGCWCCAHTHHRDREPQARGHPACHGHQPPNQPATSHQQLLPGGSLLTALEQGCSQGKGLTMISRTTLVSCSHWDMATRAPGTPFSSVNSSVIGVTLVSGHPAG